MSTVAPYAYDPRGHFAVTGDGPELLAYSGDDDKPAWKAFTDGILVGVAIAGEHVWTLDDTGRVTTWRLIDGRKLDVVELGASCRDLAVAPEGVAAALAEDGVRIVSGGMQQRHLPVSGASALSFGPNAGSIGVGTEGGTFHAMDPASGAAWGSVDLGGPVRGVAWSAGGHWVVSAGNQLVLVSGDGSQVVHRFPPVDGGIGRLTASGEGPLVAAIENQQHVGVYELVDRSRVGEIRFRREVADIEFGPGTWLGVGHEDGDATRVDVLVGTNRRTLPHEGRAHSPWTLDVHLDPARIRGALARGRVQGGPVATEIKQEWHQKPKKNYEQGGEESGGNCLPIGCGVLLVLFLCTGCCGLGWWFA